MITYTVQYAYSEFYMSKSVNRKINTNFNMHS